LRVSIGSPAGLYRLFQRVEGDQERMRVLPLLPELLKLNYAFVIAAHHLPVDQTGAGRFHNSREAL
jgi:hypothetical protein